MYRYPKLSRFTHVAVDLLLVIVSYFLAVGLRNLLFGGAHGFASYLDFPQLLLNIIIIWWCLLVFFEMTASASDLTLGKLIRNGLQIDLIGLGLFFSTSFLCKAYFPRSLIMLFGLIYIVAYVVSKLVVREAFSKLSESKAAPILIAGTGRRAKEFCVNVDRGRIKGYHIVGFLDKKEDRIGKKLSGRHYIIGSFQEIKEILTTYAISEVLVILPPKDMNHLEHILEVSEEAGVTARVVFDPEKFNVGAVTVGYTGGYPSICYSRLPSNETGLFVKRILDIVVSAALLVLLSPFFLIIAALIKATSKGPVFFHWKVVGRNNRDFTGYKFRTMVENAEELKATLMTRNEMSGPCFKMKNDPRITPVGRWLRKFSLDELPQLWSVLKGDMSLVGPRPPNRNELARFEFWQRRKISFKPGMTCLWQVNGRNGISDFAEWCRLDLEYIDNWSLLLDLKILLKTAGAVMRGTGC